MSILPHAIGCLQQGVTGKLRRILTVVLPFAVMGIYTPCLADYNHLADLCLNADYVNRVFSGTNQAVYSANLSYDSTKTIQ